MKRIICIAFLTIGSFTLAKAQTEHDPAIRAKDSLIKVTLIDPAEATANGDAPDWAALKTDITAKYDATYADRTVTKAQIYFYYGKDWPKFCAGIVHYTDKYEDQQDLKLLNTNAKMILQYSSDKAELQSAAGWSKMAVAKEPGNADYKATYDALQTKLAGK